jgi:hypothetical protein
VSTTGLRRVTNSGGPRRVTNPGGPTTGSRRGLTGERPALPEAPPRFLPKSPEDVTPPEGLPSLAMPVDLPVEDDAAPSLTAAMPRDADEGTVSTRIAPREKDPLASMRAAKAQEEKERTERTQKLVRNISLSIFAVVVVLVLFVVLRPKPDTVIPTTTIWVTSTPPGAALKLNGKEVKGKTPMFVDGFIINEANTLVVTLPDHLAWTKRFTPDGRSDAPVHADLKRSTPEAAPAPTPPVKPAPEAVADAGVETSDAGSEALAAKPPAAPDGEVNEDGEEIDFHETVYPTRLLVLRTAYNAMPIGEYEMASIELNPGTAYSVRTEGSAAYSKDSPSSGVLAYFLEGDLQADDSFGVIGGSPHVIKGAKRMYFFAIDETPPSDNRGAIRIQFSESKWKPPRYLTFEPQKHAVQLKPEHQMWLHGLHPKSIYLLTVRDDFAELH